jgi:UDP-N-acetylmuramate--alanine ligase
MLGIGGCGMSGLARMLAARGAYISGSDKEQSLTTDQLLAEGIDVSFDQDRPWLPERCDLVVATAAIRPDHPQLLAALERNIPTMLYAEALGKCMLGRTGIAVAGTHGKSSTTAMLGCALTDAGLDPTVIVGATSNQLSHGALGAKSVGTGFRLGSPRVRQGDLQGQPGLLLAEACEFNRSFHNLRPRFASISHVEADHLDVYGTLDAVVDAFHQFAELLPPAAEGGRLLIAHDATQRLRVTSGLSCTVETIGFSPEADWQITFDGSSREVTLQRGRDTVATWRNQLPGAPMAFNAAVAMTLALWSGADPATCARSLQAFEGIDRRMQFKGERPVPLGAVRVYDDYGHHPTEVDSTLRALREAERPEDRGGRLICVFQPHQHSRTRHLMEEFATSFGKADVVLVPPIYFVRDSEEEKQRVTSADLVQRLREKGVAAEDFPSFDAIVERLNSTCTAGDLVVVMGAGPVWRVADAFLAGA